MDNYRDELYRTYASTHTLPRKGRLTPESLRVRTKQWARQFGPLLPQHKNARILDGGCGDGALLWWMQQLGYHAAEGIEVSNEQVALAHSLGARAVHEGDLQQFLAERPHEYDLVILRNVLEHFDKPDVLPLLRLVHRAIAPGGALVVQVPNAESPFFGRIRYGDFTHGLAFCSTSLAQVFAACGFVNHRFFPVRTYSPGVRGLVRRGAWRLVESVYRGLLTTELGRGRYVVSQDIVARTEKLP